VKIFSGQVGMSRFSRDGELGFGKSGETKFGKPALPGSVRRRRPYKAEQGREAVLQISSGVRVLRRGFGVKGVGWDELRSTGPGWKLKKESTETKKKGRGGGQKQCHCAKSDISGNTAETHTISKKRPTDRSVQAALDHKTIQGSGGRHNKPSKI